MEYTKVILAISLIPLLSGCIGGTIQTKEVLIPVPIVVKIDRPMRPLLTSSEISLVSFEDKIRAAEIDLSIMIKYSEDLERLIDAHDKTKPNLNGFELIKK